MTRPSIRLAGLALMPVIAPLIVALFSFDLAAQALDLRGGEDGQPIAIDAAGGIEWNQDDNVFIASGPATATQGDMVLKADELRAYYRDEARGKSQIFRLDAIGTVRITAPGRVATGGRAIYDVDKAVVVLKDANPVKMVSGSDVITATDQMEFWDQRSLAVARGAAQAIRADKRIRADVLTAYFSKGPDGKSRVERIEAFDNVRIDTDKEQVFSDRAAYNVPTGLARLTGSVKIMRGANVLQGCSADIDLNTGISRLNSCKGPNGGVRGTTGASAGAKQKQSPSAFGAGNGIKSGRVRGVLTPKKRN